MEQLLKLNPDTDCYEGTFTVRVEAEIFRRVFFTYVEDHHVDPADMEAWQKAISEVARTAKWLVHPRATVMPLVEKPSAPTAPPVPEEPKKNFSGHDSLSPQDKQVLWDRAMQLPVDAWETLLTPIPKGGDQHTKKPLYYLRSAERKALSDLKKQLEPTPSERIEAIAEAVNGNKLK